MCPSISSQPTFQLGTAHQAFGYGRRIIKLDSRDAFGEMSKCKCEPSFAVCADKKRIKFFSCRSNEGALIAPVARQNVSAFHFHFQTLQGGSISPAPGAGRKSEPDTALPCPA
jgi:hypothetical protein